MTDNTRWRWLVVALIAFAALGFAACGDDDDDDDGGDSTEAAAEVEQFPPDTTLGRIQEAGEITIGVKFDVPPFGFKNPQTGDVEGFDVDLGKAIAEKLGVQPRFIEAISDNRIPFLTEGTVDLILSTMTITRERDKEIDFSEPYYIAGGRVLVPEDSDIQGVEDLGGRRVCTARGSTYQLSIKKEAPDADLRLIDTYSECFELIQDGAVDAVSTDNVILTGMIVQDDTLKMVGDEFTTEPYGAGIPDGDAELKEFVDGVIAEYIEDGRWEEAYQKWVGQYIPEEEHQDPPDMTLEEALEIAPE
jgi:ABC-type amino acid transport substrate-binding protein